MKMTTHNNIHFNDLFMDTKVEQAQWAVIRDALENY